MATTEKSTPKKSSGDKPNTEAAPNQSAEDREKILKGTDAATNTAAGQERERMMGNQDDTPTGKERGSTVKIEGEPTPDQAEGPDSKAQGAQAQPANMARNGTLPVNHVPSPSGPIPRDAVHALGLRDPEEFLKADPGFTKKTAFDLTDEEIDSLDRGTLRSVASDAGINLPMSGGRSTRNQFRTKVGEARKAQEA